MHGLRRKNIEEHMPRNDYFDKLSSELKSKFGELLLMIADEE